MNLGTLEFTEEFNGWHDALLFRLSHVYRSFSLVLPETIDFCQLARFNCLLRCWRNSASRQWAYDTVGTVTRSKTLRNCLSGGKRRVVNAVGCHSCKWSSLHRTRDYQRRRQLYRSRLHTMQGRRSCLKPQRHGHSAVFAQEHADVCHSLAFVQSNSCGIAPGCSLSWSLDVNFKRITDL